MLVEQLNVAIEKMRDTSLMKARTYIGFAAYL